MNIQEGIEKDENSYVYHLTAKENLNYISRFGLIPALGDRSRYVGDTRDFVYFSYYIDDVIKWYDKYYKNFKEEDMYMLRFKLSYAKYFLKDFKKEDFYTWCAIPKEKIDILKNYTDSGLIYRIEEIGYQKKLVWKPFVEEYKRDR